MIWRLWLIDNVKNLYTNGSTSNVVILSIGLVSEYILYVNLKSSKESISKTSLCCTLKLQGRTLTT